MVLLKVLFLFCCQIPWFFTLLQQKLNFALCVIYFLFYLKFARGQYTDHFSWGLALRFHLQFLESLNCVYKLKLYTEISCVWSWPNFDAWLLKAMVIFHLLDNGRRTTDSGQYWPPEARDTGFTLILQGKSKLDGLVIYVKKDFL